VINYRLSQGSYDIPDELQIKHPGHTQDCGLALCWLVENASKYYYDTARIYIVGHSAGAFMGSLLVLSPQTYLPSQRPEFTIRAVIGIEGIFDLNLMLKDFPTYLQWVVAPAFVGGSEEFDAASPTVIVQTSKWNDSAKFPRFMIIHSEKDELVNVPQSSTFVDALRRHWGPSERTESFITSHPSALHNAIVDRIEDGFDIVSPAIVDFIHNVERL
jgi:acetyl esterase/lipase